MLWSRTRMLPDSTIQLRAAIGLVVPIGFMPTRKAGPPVSDVVPSHSPA